ncbi:MAG: hypothetical protein M5U26_29215 [Planctomycetota bacterium]|nr:hypothetical protein [Planctomycetota bacterium]
MLDPREVLREFRDEAARHGAPREVRYVRDEAARAGAFSGWQGSAAEPERAALPVYDGEAEDEFTVHTRPRGDSESGWPALLVALALLLFLLWLGVKGQP